MNRSNFLKEAALLGLGFGLSPHFALTRQAKKPFVIGIVGAGITGLHLAKSLQSAGHAVRIFEAKNRAGGRIFQNDHFYSSPIDLGAQWIHGKNELYKIVRQRNVPIYRDTKNDLIKISYKEKLLNDFPPEFYLFIDEISKKTPLKVDMSVLNFTRNITSDSAFISLIENALTDAATSAHNLSVNEISKLTQKLKTVDYQFADITMYEFIASNYLEKLSANISYNTPINAIDYTGKTVILSANENKLYEFDKVIVTIPITELKSNKIQFLPGLPAEKTAAFNKIGMDKGLKLFLKFEKRFYTHLIFNGKYAGYYIDPTKRGDYSKQSLLASLIMGKKADIYYENPAKAIQNYLMELDALFDGQASKYFSGSFVQDWGNEEYINGVYSYTLPGGQSARAIAKQSINNRLFFAGEAMNTNKNYGNIHGAIESAMEVLKEME